MNPNESLAYLDNVLASVSVIIDDKGRHVGLTRMDQTQIQQAVNTLREAIKPNE